MAASDFPAFQATTFNNVIQRVRKKLRPNTLPQPIEVLEYRRQKNQKHRYRTFILNWTCLLKQAWAYKISQLSRLAHVHYQFPDLEKACPFFEDFGFVEVERVEGKVYYRDSACILT